MIDRIEVPAAATSVELPYTASKAVTVTARDVGSSWTRFKTPKDLTANPLVVTFEANESKGEDLGVFEFTFTDEDGNSVTRQVIIIHRADIEFAVEASHDHIVFDKETSSVVVTFTGNKGGGSIDNFNVWLMTPRWMIAKRLDPNETDDPVRVLFYPEPNTTSEVRTGLFGIKISGGVAPYYGDVYKVVTFEQAPGAQAEPAEYNFSVPNTTIKVNNAEPYVPVPFISTVVPYDGDFTFEIVDSPSWIYPNSYAPMMYTVRDNKAEGASERNAQVNYTYTDPRGIGHTGSFRICQSATKSIE
ncbi:MAG: hypothetical protein IJ654_08710 [Bacteroidales bacterium]|nr:hypothetical protein [Bacteroidales bacterium]